MFSESHLFYRPLVQLSFGITDVLFGVDPMPYALTNLLLGLACAATFALARAGVLAFVDPAARPLTNRIFAFRPINGRVQPVRTALGN